MLRRVPGQGGSIENGDPKDLLARQLLKPEQRHLRHAEELARQAVRAAPRLSAGHVALALALLEQKNAEAAIAALRAALRRLYEAQGRAAEARQVRAEIDRLAGRGN